MKPDISIITECASLSNPNNGGVTTTYDNKYGSVATFTCQADFLLVGDNILKCLENETWNGTAPSCKQKGNILSQQH